MHQAVADYLKPDMKPVIPRFMTQAIHMEAASRQAGRPIYEDREFVEIIIPGVRQTSAFEPVSDEHKSRWPKEYEAFKAGLELPLEGTPLSEWPSAMMTRARVEELAFFNVRTVEHLAALDDAKIQNLGMGAREMRNAAQKFLEVAKQGTGPLERLLADRDAHKTRADIAEAQLKEAGAEITRLRAQIEQKGA